MADELAVAERFAALGPFLDERTRRLWAGAEARAIGRGGIEAVHRATRIARDTIRGGLRDLDDESLAGSQRVRRPGGGRTPEVARDPALLDDLRALIEADTLGDPQSPLLWVSKSLRHLADGLRAQGHRANKNMVAGLLRTLGYSLQANAKTREGTQHPDRDAQFDYLNHRVAASLDAGEPVISVDTKKKELVGAFKNGGRELRPKGDPLRVSTHDFVIPELGRAAPYGVYDIADNSAWVSVGTDADTASFAVESIRRWWQRMGQLRYPAATQLTGPRPTAVAPTATAAGCGSSSFKGSPTSCRSRSPSATCRPRPASGTRSSTACLSHITLNWRGKPLISHEVIISLIAATTTNTGLTVQAALDDGTYPKGIKVPDAQVAALSITKHDFHGEWNYTITPRPQDQRQ